MNSAYSQTCNSKVIWGRNSIRLLSQNVETMQSTYFHVASIIFDAILETQEIKWVSERVRITLKMACSLILANVFGFQFSKMKVTAWYWNCSKGKRGEPHTHSRSTKIGQCIEQSRVTINRYDWANNSDNFFFIYMRYEIIPYLLTSHWIWRRNEKSMDLTTKKRPTFQFSCYQ